MIYQGIQSCYRGRSLLLFTVPQEYFFPRTTHNETQVPGQSVKSAGWISWESISRERWNEVLIRWMSSEKEIEEKEWVSVTMGGDLATGWDPPGWGRVFADSQEMIERIDGWRKLERTGEGRMKKKRLLYNRMVKEVVAKSKRTRLQPSAYLPLVYIVKSRAGNWQKIMRWLYLWHNFQKH